MRISWVDEVKEWRPLDDPLLQLCVGLGIRSDKAWSAHREEILGELLVLQQFGTGHPHQLYRAAHEPDIIDVLRPVGAGAGKPYPSAVGSGIGEDAMPELRRKVLPDRDFPTHHAVRLRITAPLVIPRRPMLCHVFPNGVDHGLEMLLLVWLYPFLGDPVSFVLAPSVDHILN